MGGYQLSLQGTTYNPAARLDSRKSGSSDGSSRRSSRTMESPNRGFGYGGKRQSNLEGLVHPSPPRHSTACCDGLSLRRELSSQRIKAAADAVESRGHSFRSDDSDSLALWEEMDSMSSSSSVVAASVAPSERDGWVKLSTQSPRWLDAMAKLAPWRSSPVHPRSGDTPRASLDRKSSTRSLHDSRKGWYTKRSRSMWSPKVATNSAKWDQASSKGDQSSEDGSKHGSFSRMMDEDTRFTASAVAWDISAGREPAVENSTRPVSGLAWEIPVVDGKITDDTLPESARESSASEEAQFDGHSEYASCRTFVEDELLSPAASDDAKSANEVGFVNVIDFVAPLLSKLQSIEKEGPRTERRVSFKWEAGPKIRGEEVAPTTETPKPPGDAAAYETLRQQYLLKSQSAPLDGLYMFMPESNSALPWERKPAGEGALRRVNSSPEPRMSRTAPGPSPLGMDSKSDPESPRSILRGPDDGSSVPSSSNPSRRSEGPQSMSSCSESFDDYELMSSTAYNLNSACIIVESRRVSLSFRDFGPAQPADMAEARESSNVELLGCDRAQLSDDALRASPELWTATFSARYTHDADEPTTASPQPMRQLAYLMSCEDEQDQQRPMAAEMQRNRSRNGEFTARLGVMFSPLRLISSHDSSNHGGCFVAATVSPPHDDDEESHTIVKILSPSLELQSTARKSEGYWTGTHSRSSKRRHSSDDPQTMMVSFSKAMKKILSKCTVKRSTSKGKSKTDSPALKALPPPEFQFT